MDEETTLEKTQKNKKQKEFKSDLNSIARRKYKSQEQESTSKKYENTFQKTRKSYQVIF